MSVLSPDAGLQLDDDTLCLYKSIAEFEWNAETGELPSDDAVADDSGNGWNLTSGGNLFRANGPLGADGWRNRAAAAKQFAAYLHSNVTLPLQSAVINSTVPAAARAEHTLQVMFRLEWPLGAQRGIMAVANNTAGAGIGNDWIDRLSVGAAGELSYFSESNDIDTALATPAASIEPGRWHVATARFVDAGDGVNFNTTLWCHRLNADGTVSETGTASGVTLLCDPNSGLTDGRIMYGADDLSQSNFVGAIAYGRFYKAALDDAACAAQAEELLTTGAIAEPGLDSDHLYRHEFNRMPSFVDEGPYGLHGRGGSTAQPWGNADGFIDLIGSRGRARRNWRPNVAGRYAHAHTLQADLSAAGPVYIMDLFTDEIVAVPELTFQCWALRLNEIAFNLLINDASGETLTTNHIIALSMGTGGLMSYFAERGAGVNIDRVNDVGSWDTGVLTQLRPTLYTLRMGPKPGAPGTLHWRVSIGADIDVYATDATGVPQGGRSNSYFLAYFGDAQGLCQEFKWSKAQISDAQIIADAARTLAHGEEDPPTVTVVSPAAGATIAPTDPVVVDVTDAIEFGFAELSVKYAGRATEVVVRDGSFRYPYSGTRAAIEGGYRYTVSREGGWPRGNARWEAIAIDAAGNRAA